MIRTAILACTLVAVPSLALAQARIATPPEVRLLRPPAAAPDRPPTNVSDVVPGYDGWIHHEVDGGGLPFDSNARTVTLYQGRGYPATIMVCTARAPLRLLPRDEAELVLPAERCATFTTDHLRVATLTETLTERRSIYYRILAIHRAAD